MKPPSIVLLTPNGRFEVNTKICLSISGYHPETWLPSWSIRTVLIALIGFMSTPADTSYGAVNFPSDARKKLAIKSRCWSCPTCGPIREHLKSSSFSVFDKPKESEEMLDEEKVNQNEPTIATVEAVPIEASINSQPQQPINLSFKIMMYNILIVLIAAILIARFFALIQNLQK